MQHVITLVEQHGLLVVFLNALLAQSGLPLPHHSDSTRGSSFGRKAIFRSLKLSVAGIGGITIADFFQYWCGRQYGQRFLGLLCRVSFSPDFCVRRTQEVFARMGPWSLVLAKFIPGLSLISVAMAGVTKMSVFTFLLLDLIGGMVFIDRPRCIGRDIPRCDHMLPLHARGLREVWCRRRPHCCWIVRIHKMVAATIIYSSVAHGSHYRYRTPPINQRRPRLCSFLTSGRRRFVSMMASFRARSPRTRQTLIPL